MNWKNYSYLSNTHAFLSPSRYHWINYSDDKLLERYINHKRVELGTRLHALAAELISLARRQPQTGEAFNAFVNDAIGFGMSPEVILHYSPNCYGTADAIAYSNGVLRIHDLKTGKTPASIDQLMVYAGLFYLDYEIEAKELTEVYLRIYQGEEVVQYSPKPIDVINMARRIVAADKLIQKAENSVII